MKIYIFFEKKGAPLANTADNLRLFDMARSVHWLPKDSGAGGSGGGERLPRGSHKREVESDDEEMLAIAPAASGAAVGIPMASSMGSTTGPPQNDIYRRRQQKRVK